MAAAVGKFAAKKMLSKQLKQYKDKEPAGQYVSTIHCVCLICLPALATQGQSRQLNQN
jgi:hypothetical protein